MQVQRLREFKINGTVGDKDQKDILSYTSLSFQMEQGRKAGYSPREIQVAVIKAMRAGSNLRNYLESKPDIDADAFIKVLRSHYKEKDATSVFHEMSNSYQLLSESEHEFCLRAMSLHQKVLALSREENFKFDEVLVQKQFFHAIFTGLKHNSIRFELQNVLKAGVISDEELLHEISLTASTELEHLHKIKSKVSSNPVSVSVSDSFVKKYF